MRRGEATDAADADDGCRECDDAEYLKRALGVRHADLHRLPQHTRLNAALDGARRALDHFRWRLRHARQLERGREREDRQHLATRIREL